jgi:hypothetical protein
MDQGRIWIADDFDAPLPDDLLKAFYGGKLRLLRKLARSGNEVLAGQWCGCEA